MQYFGCPGLSIFNCFTHYRLRHLTNVLNICSSFLFPAFAFLLSLLLRSGELSTAVDPCQWYSFLFPTLHTLCCSEFQPLTCSVHFNTTTRHMQQKWFYVYTCTPKVTRLEMCYIYMQVQCVVDHFDLLHHSTPELRYRVYCLGNFTRRPAWVYSVLESSQNLGSGLLYGITVSCKAVLGV